MGRDLLEPWLPTEHNHGKRETGRRLDGRVHDAGGVEHQFGDGPDPEVDQEDDDEADEDEDLQTLEGGPDDICGFHGVGPV